MKRLKFLFIGHPKNPGYKTLEEDYFQKVKNHQHSAEILYLKDSSEKDITKRNHKEGEALLSKLKPQDFLVLCDEHGKTLDTLAFSSKLRILQDERDEIVFAVGGAYGFSEAVKARANLTIKMAPWTLPHELARVVLLEQVYRALTLHAGKKYHH